MIAVSFIVGFVVLWWRISSLDRRTTDAFGQAWRDHRDHEKRIADMESRS